VRRDNDGKTQLVLLDHGLYQRLKTKDMVALSHMWKAIVLQDHAKMKLRCARRDFDPSAFEDAPVQVEG
jgi:predicted unusual protein kinase regulating ubiquinone biosynthesis (AarF/ABC1/UbiB family)